MAVRARVCFMYCPNSPGFLELKKKRGRAVCGAGRGGVGKRRGGKKKKRENRRGKKERKKKKELTKSNQFSAAHLLPPLRTYIRIYVYTYVCVYVCFGQVCIPPPPLTLQKSIPLKTTLAARVHPVHRPFVSLAAAPGGIKVPQLARFC